MGNAANTKSVHRKNSGRKMEYRMSSLMSWKWRELWWPPKDYDLFPAIVETMATKQRIDVKTMQYVIMQFE